MVRSAHGRHRTHNPAPRRSTCWTASSTRATRSPRTPGSATTSRWPGTWATNCGHLGYADLKDVEARSEHFVNSDKTKGGYRSEHAGRPGDHRPGQPPAQPAPQAGQQVVRALRGVREWEQHVRTVCVDILDAAVAKGTVEVVGDLASVLPAMMIGRLLGFPEDQGPLLRDWSERTIALGGGPRYRNDDGHAAVGEFATAGLALFEEKKRCPADDVMTTWTRASIDGQPIGPAEVISDCLLLLDGGAETTRTVIARTFLNLIAHPEQWDLIRGGADLTVATEEFIRYVTPIHNMCRVAVGDQRVGDTVIPDGHQVVMMYGSANRDPRVFADPEKFDVTRSPNDHITFGFGTHFCLGAPLARLEIRIFFEELLEARRRDPPHPGHRGRRHAERVRARHPRGVRRPRPARLSPRPSRPRCRRGTGSLRAAVGTDGGPGARLCAARSGPPLRTNRNAAPA
ncbi:cytochrome P450 [Yinghuangia aomiensis]